MEIVMAESAGMCFGVRDALKIMAELPEPSRVTVHGELVHNETILQQLSVRGFRQTAEADRDRLPDTPAVLITAHGVSDRERVRLAGAGKDVIDTTCPLVRRAHAAALKLRDDGRHVLVVGRPGHVEVCGLTEDLPSHDVVPDVASVRRYESDRLGVVYQTTTPPPLAAAVREAILSRNPHADVRSIDTVCRPTREHQESLSRLLPVVDAVVVVGGANSNNTRELARRAAAAGRAAYHVQGPADVRADWFRPGTRVGLTAGTSTPDETIAAVRAELERVAIGFRLGA